MNKVDEYYPIDNDVKIYPVREMGYIMKINNHLQDAKAGDKIAESKLCNRLGALRRSMEFQDMSPDLQDVIKEAAAWLRTTGRKVDFANKEPSMWITTRSGKPRF